MKNRRLVIELRQNGDIGQYTLVFQEEEFFAGVWRDVASYPLSGTHKVVDIAVSWVGNGTISNI